MATDSNILARKSHGQRSLVGCGPWGHKQLDATEESSLSLYLPLIHTYIYRYTHTHTHTHTNIHTANTTQPNKKKEMSFSIADQRVLC